MAKGDISRLNSKIKKQHAEIKRLKAEIKAYLEGSIQLSAALDGILAQVAFKWGEKTETGAWEVALPLICVDKSRRENKVSARVGEDNDSYIIKVEPRAEEG